MTGRKLSTMELSLLRAVVELGDGAYGVPVRRHAEAALGRSVSYGDLYATMNRLEEEGFLRGFDVTGDYPQRDGLARRNWRPAFDLTEVLKGEV